MKIIITEFNESKDCQWCSRSAEGVTARFEDGFLSRGHLCWKCLQRATRVHATQQAEQTQPKTKETTQT